MYCTCSMLFMCDSTEFSLRSLVYALCKIFGVKIFKSLLPPVFIQYFNQTFCKYVGHERIYKLLRFGWSAKLKKKKYGGIKFLLTQDHVVLEISKCYSPYAFHLIAFSQTSWGHWLPWWSTGHYFSWQPISQGLETLNFNMGVNGKILKCTRSWKQLIIE